MRWTRKGIIEEIRRLHTAGEELNYKAVEENHLNLVRAASWHFGTWKRAIEKAGLDYDDVSKYQKWTRERVIARIQELYKEGKDLSWRAISTEVDPPLAAAALRENSGFESWYDAITASGLNHDEIARYRRWTKERVLEEILDRSKKGLPMSSISVQRQNSPLYCAAKRRFLQWDNALRTAGLDPDKIRIRKAPEAAAPRRRRGAAGQLAEPEVISAVPLSLVRPSSRRRNGDIPTLEEAVALATPGKNGKAATQAEPAKGRRGRKPVIEPELVEVAEVTAAPKKGKAAKAAPVVEAPAAPVKKARGKAAPEPEIVAPAPKSGRKAKVEVAPAPAPEPTPVKKTRGKAAATPVVATPAATAKKTATPKSAPVVEAPAAKTPAKKGSAAKVVATPAPAATAKTVAKAPAKTAPAKMVAKATAPAKATTAAKKAAPAKAAVEAKAPAKAAKTETKAPAKATKVAAATPAKATKATAKTAPAPAPAKTTKASAKAAPASPAPAGKPSRAKAAPVETPAPAPARRTKAAAAPAPAATAAPVAKGRAKAAPAPVVEAPKATKKKAAPAIVEEEKPKKAKAREKEEKPKAKKKK